MFQWQSQAWRSIQLSAVPLKRCMDGVLVNPLLHPPRACLTHPGCEFFVARTAYRCESVQSSEENKNWRLLNWYILNLSFFLVLFIKNSITDSLYNSSCGIFHAAVTQPGNMHIISFPPFVLQTFNVVQGHNSKPAREPQLHSPSRRSSHHFRPAALPDPRVYSQRTRTAYVTTKGHFFHPSTRLEKYQKRSSFVLSFPYGICLLGDSRPMQGSTLISCS